MAGGRARLGPRPFSWTGYDGYNHRPGYVFASDRPPTCASTPPTATTSGGAVARGATPHRRHRRTPHLRTDFASASCCGHVQTFAFARVAKPYIPPRTLAFLTVAACAANGRAGPQMAQRLSPCGAHCGNISSHEPSHPDQALEDVRCRSARERRDGFFHVRLPGSWDPAARQRSRPLHRLQLGGKNPNMFRLMQIEEKISEALGISVTITTRDALHPLMKESIERDAVRVT
jgi:hypothetical protein